MCGIAGFFGRRPVSGLAVDAMRAAIARRGPDAFHVAGCRVSAAQFVLQDQYAGLSSALLHARLSIRDPRPVADQPMRFLRFTGMSNSVTSYVCVSELEVYGVLPPPPWLEFSTGGVNVREGGEGRFFVRLGSAPTATVVVAVAPAGGSPNVVIQSGATRTFRPSNWNVWQAVVLAAGADADAASETATFRLSAPGREDRIIEATTLDDGPGRNLALAAGGSSIAGPGSQNASQQPTTAISTPIATHAG